MTAEQLLQDGIDGAHPRPPRAFGLAVDVLEDLVSVPGLYRYAVEDIVEKEPPRAALQLCERGVVLLLALAMGSGQDARLAGQRLFTYI